MFELKRVELLELVYRDIDLQSFHKAIADVQAILDADVSLSAVQLEPRYSSGVGTILFWCHEMWLDAHSRMDD